MELVVGIAVRTWSSHVWLKEKTEKLDEKHSRLRRVAGRVVLMNRFAHTSEDAVDASSSGAALFGEVAREVALEAVMMPFDIGIFAAATHETRRAGAGADPFWSHASTISAIAAREGVGALWNGVAPGALACALRKLPRQPRIPDDDFNHSDAAALVKRAAVYLWRCVPNVLVSALTHPLNLLSHRMMLLGGEEYSSLSSAWTTVVTREGWRGLFKGYSLSLLDSIWPTNFVPFYEFTGELRLTEIVFPLASVRLAMQVSESEHKGVGQVIAQTVRDHGILGFFSGVRAMMWSMPASLLGLVVDWGVGTATGRASVETYRSVGQRLATFARRLIVTKHPRYRKPLSRAPLKAAPTKTEGGDGA